jgi:hypothetical protein
MHNAAPRPHRIPMRRGRAGVSLRAGTLAQVRTMKNFHPKIVEHLIDTAADDAFSVFRKDCGTK